MNVLFLLGAGASCDADVNAKNPPLGNKLFDELVYFDPVFWGNLPAALAKVFREDFESGIRLLLNSTNNNLVDLHKAMAKFFLDMNQHQIVYIINLFKELMQVIAMLDLRR